MNCINRLSEQRVPYSWKVNQIRSRKWNSSPWMDIVVCCQAVQNPWRLRQKFTALGHRHVQEPSFVALFANGNFCKPVICIQFLKRLLNRGECRALALSSPPTLNINFFTLTARSNAVVIGPCIRAPYVQDVQIQQHPVIYRIRCQNRSVLHWSILASIQF